MALLINKKKGISSEGERENRQHPVSGFFRPVIQKSPTTTITNQSIEKSPITGTRVRFFVGQGQS
jgi:hypothetical protein